MINSLKNIFFENDKIIFDYIHYLDYNRCMDLISNKKLYTKFYYNNFYMRVFSFTIKNMYGYKDDTIIKRYINIYNYYNDVSKRFISDCCIDRINKNRIEGKFINEWDVIYKNNQVIFSKIYNKKDLIIFFDHFIFLKNHIGIKNKLSINSKMLIY